FIGQWLGNIDTALKGQAPTYLIVQHMEPDHSAGIAALLDKYPSTTVVSSANAFKMMKNFFGTEFESRRVVVKEGDTLEVGKHVLNFVSAPMVHWPEVILTYDSYAKTLFSADAFGKFGALDVEDEEGWDCEARRYYIGIVGKYGVQVQNVLKKAAGLDIQRICPLHGPILDQDLGHYISLYNTWSSYQPEDEGVTIAYTSVYGHTKAAALKLAEMLENKGKKIEVFDLARDDMAEAVEAAFRYSKIVLATTTYNTEIFPYMREFINHLVERNFQKRTVALIENGSWAPQAAKVMTKMLEPCKDIVYAANNVKIMSALQADSEASLKALAEEL
ncbi:MAG: FprA family A-type flavoprotein, partial [Sphaerochaetaceae bacterium]|nr:FprA family A-type flavoprotein [Sphaerochaetaceae bacterium]